MPQPHRGESLLSSTGASGNRGDLAGDVAALTGLSEKLSEAVAEQMQLVQKLLAARAVRILNWNERNPSPYARHSRSPR